MEWSDIFPRLQQLLHLAAAGAMSEPRGRLLDSLMPQELCSVPGGAVHEVLRIPDLLASEHPASAQTPRSLEASGPPLASMSQRMASLSPAQHS